jgi:hypothetical protein
MSSVLKVNFKRMLLQGILWVKGIYQVENATIFALTVTIPIKITILANLSRDSPP